MIFTKTKYTKWYFELVERAKNRHLSEYIEIHHIIPRSLGGSDCSSNLVKLTAREHYICHMLLPKMVNKEDQYKMVWALHRMAFSGRFYSRDYEYARVLHQKNMIENHPSKRAKGWSTKVSDAVLSHWKDNDERRKQTSETFKKWWKENREVALQHQKKAAKLGGQASAKIYRGKKRGPNPKLQGEKNGAAGEYIITFPNGEVKTIKFLKGFCEDHNLSYACMIKVSSGHNKQHKGFKITRPGFEYSNPGKFLKMKGDSVDE